MAAYLKCLWFPCAERRATDSPTGEGKDFYIKGIKKKSWCTTPEDKDFYIKGIKKIVMHN